MTERVRHGSTGFVAGEDETFAQHAIDLLTNDSLWHRQHQAALSLQQGWSWDEMAAAFEARVIQARPVNPVRRTSEKERARRPSLSHVECVHPDPGAFRA